MLFLASPAALLCLAVVPVCLLQAGAVVAETMLEERLRQRVERLADVRSRVTGYPGCGEAADWLLGRLRKAGIDEVYELSFKVPVPIDEGFQLVSKTDTVAVHAMWPNLVRTPTLPPSGLSGHLVYGGLGLQDLGGLGIVGRIVLLEYRSGAAWLDVFHLGAAAVIFLDAEGSHRKEAEQKFLDVPANLPRFYAEPREASILRRLAVQGRRVRLDGRMTWTAVRGRTLVGIIPGADLQLRQEAVLVNAYFDAISPVPALAPGAEQACAAAVLLELAQEMVERPPARTVLVVLTSGHFQNLSGMRHLAPLLREAAGGRKQPGRRSDTEVALLARLDDLTLRLFVGLDLTSASDMLGVFKQVTPYRLSIPTPPITARLMRIAAAYEDVALAGRRILANGLKRDFHRQRLGGLPQTIPFEAAPAALAGCPALTFCTTNDARARVDSPADIPRNVSYSSLANQVEFLENLLTRIVDDPELENWEWGTDAFGTLRGEVMHYGSHSYLPDQPTAGALVRVRLRDPTLAGVRPDFWAVADDSGRFVIPGMETRIIYTQPVRIEAYGVDPTGGQITDVPDWGINGERRLPGRRLVVQMDDWDKEVRVVTTRATGLALFEITDPRRLRTLEQVAVIDAATDAELPRFGACLPLTPAEIDLFSYRNRRPSWVWPVGVVFAPEGTQIKAAMTTGRYGLGRRLLLVNGESTAPEGVGYTVGGSGRLPLTVYLTARDINRLNDKRIASLARHGVRNHRLDAFHTKAEHLLHQVPKALEDHRHQEVLDLSRRAWAYGTAAYNDVARTRNSVVNGALLLLAVLIPFVYCLERLVYGSGDLRRQLVAGFGLFALGFAALRYLHPAFELAISPMVILLGFVILSLSVLVAGIGVGRLNRELQDLSAGHHRRIEVRRVGTLIAALAVGLAHMRRRPLRTGLTCITLVLLTFSVLSFTTIRSTLRTNTIALEEVAAYSGALIRRPAWKALEVQAYHILRDRFGAQHTAPRAWLSVSSLSLPYRVERVGSLGRFTGVLGIAGLTAQEASMVAPQRDLVAGRWLAPGEDDSCVLPRSIADSLGIAAPEVGQVHILVFGETFQVVGILGDDALERPDLNGESLTPLDPDAQQPVESEVERRGSAPVGVYTHLPGARVIVLPYAAVIRWENARLVSVGLRIGATEISELAETLDLNLFVGRDGRRYLVNTVGIASVSGLGQLLVPVGIVALIVLNTMLGSVYERLREIGIFNAVGLAPLHVSGLFVAEALAFGLVGVIPGYLLGQIAAQVLSRWQLLTGLELNYSSLSGAMTLGMVLGLVLLSAIYPAQLAGRICTPGIERRWRPQLPDGDKLILDLPFTIAWDDAPGMAAFQTECWEAYTEQSIGLGYYVERLTMERDAAAVRLRCRVWLAPFDRGVSQDVVLSIAAGADPRFCTIVVDLCRVAGDYETWRRAIRTFLDDLRKQFLIWRSLAPADREVYSPHFRRSS